MDNQRPTMFIPALIGGAVAGILANIPFIIFPCCIWVMGGAMLAAYLLVKDSPVALRSGDGAIVGVFTGIVAAVVHAVVNILLQPFIRDIFQRLIERAAEYIEEMPPGYEDLLEGGGFETSVPVFFLGLVVWVIVFSLFGALGGIIGISLFGKKAARKIKGVSDASENTGDRQP